MQQTKFSFSNNRLARLAIIIILAIAYYATAEVSRQIASTPQSVTPVWPPDGLAVGAVLLFGNWVWSGVLLGSFLANVRAFQDSTSLSSLVISTLPVLGIAIGTMLGTLLGAALLRRSVNNSYSLERVSNVSKFLILTGMFSPIVNATVGVTCLALSGKVPWVAYQTVWLTWWVSNVSGIFIVTPVMLSWERSIRNYKPAILRRWSISPQTENDATILEIQYQFKKITIFRILKITEPLLLFGLVILVGEVAFGSSYHLEYMIVPVLIWAAFCLGQPGGTLLTFVVATIAVISTVKGGGAFEGSTLNESLIWLESFIGVITLTILMLTAAISERKEAESKLRFAFAELAKTNETLEIRVRQRTEELNEKNTVLEQTLQTLQRTQAQMVQSEKMSALGQLVAGIAHEINNPVNFIHGNITHAGEYSEDLLELMALYQHEYLNPTPAIAAKLEAIDLDFLIEDLPKLFASMKFGTERIREIVKSLRLFSRLDEAEVKPVDIHDGIDSTLMILQSRLKAQADRPEIQIVKNYGNVPEVECFPGQLNQVFMNILANAIDALEERNKNSSLDEQKQNPSTIHIITEIIAERQISIRIIDNGIGIPPQIKEKIFDPFFTTKPIGKGTGMGMSISYQIVVEKHRGQLFCYSILGEGTEFAIQIPRTYELTK